LAHTKVFIKKLIKTPVLPYSLRKKIKVLDKIKGTIPGNDIGHYAAQNFDSLWVNRLALRRHQG